MDTTPVSFRLENELWTRYSAAAQAQGLPLATYLRRRLGQEDERESELASLRRAVELAMSNPADPGTPAITPGALVEMLLLLRSLVTPQKAAIAQKEVERRGFEIWR